MKIDIDEEVLEHDIVDIDGITLLCPRLLASDVAHDLLIEFAEDKDVDINDVIFECQQKIADICMEMVMEVKNILKDNDVWVI